MNRLVRVALALTVTSVGIVALPITSHAASAGNMIIGLHYPASVVTGSAWNVTGQVVDSASHPLAGAQVFIAVTQTSTHCDPADCIDTTYSTTTDSNGKFSVPGQAAEDTAIDLYPPDDTGFQADLAGAKAFSIHTHNQYRWKGHTSIKVPMLTPGSLAADAKHTVVNGTDGAPVPVSQVSRDGGKHWRTVGSGANEGFLVGNLTFTGTAHPVLSSSKPGDYLARIRDNGAAFQDPAHSPVVHIRVTKRKVPTWLRYTNQVRHSLGLQTVFEKKSFSVADRKHVHWMVRNNTICHCETRHTPGYTKAGDRAGQHSVLELGGATSIKRAVDIWLGAPFHATCLLRSNWSVGGFAIYAGAAAEWCLPGIQVFDLSTPQGRIQPDRGHPLAFPAKQARVPVDILTNRGENPSPTTACPGSWSRGWGVPLLFRVAHAPSADRKLRHPSIQLRRGHHRITPVCTFSASTFHGGNPYENKYVVRPILAEGPWVVGLIHQRLSRGATYTATLTDKHYKQSTTFTIAH